MDGRSKGSILAMLAVYGLFLVSAYFLLLLYAYPSPSRTRRPLRRSVAVELNFVSKKLNVLIGRYCSITGDRTLVPPELRPSQSVPLRTRE